MILTSKETGNFTIVNIEGNIILEETETIKNFLEPLIETPEVKGIIINGSKVEYIDSSGLGLIVSMYKTLTKSNKKFALSELSAKTMEIFILTRLNEILIISDSDDNAIEQLK
ncbi:MAG: STAS domain-containing protein [Deltaproteobacteria bacterium]|nr:STAS domain-containing protein [Deltaproteobacteria bacterium]